ncbi:uncharacterized protein LOC143297122 [Babylonia areolata]|uniref:uncharacterized protein LOC143297122 n=1 Tax=Babylonia areolata TaxID=304850 RepID=UPI003FD27CD0
MAAEEEASEKISLHTLEDPEERPPVKELTWREKVAHFMSTNKVQYTIIVLVVLDSLIVVFELLIDMEIIVIPEDHHHHHDTAHNNDTTSANGSSSSPLSPNHTHHPLLDPLHPFPNHTGTLLNSAIATTFRNHSANATVTGTRGDRGGGDGGGAGGGEGGGGHHGHHGGQGVEGGEGVVEGGHHAPNKHLTEEVLHMASLTILTIFLVEVLFKIYAEGKHILKHKAEVFDAVVVVVSFTMDITFIIVPVSQATQDYAGLLVLLRLWRVTRIINGVILSVKMDADKKLKAQKVLREKAEKQVQRLTDKLEKLTRENQKLRTRLALLEGRNSSSNNADPTTTATTTPDDDGDDEDDNGGGGGGGGRGGGGGELRPLPHAAPGRSSRLSSSSARQDEEGVAFFAPRESSSLPQLLGATPPATPRRDDSSSLLHHGHGHGGSPPVVSGSSATTPPHVDQRRSPALRYGYATTPQGGRRSEGGSSGLRTPPVESQQLLSFEEPVSEETEDLRGIREVEITSLNPPVVGGKLVTSEHLSCGVVVMWGIREVEITSLNPPVVGGKLVTSEHL